MIHDSVEAHADRTPDAAAVSGARRNGEQTLTYSELDRRADRLAQELVALGVGPDTLVAVALDRSPVLVVALLAVLKAGGAYLPLEADDPATLLAKRLADARPRLLLTTTELRHRLPDTGVPVHCLDAPAPAGSAGRVLRRALPDHPAYVLYTSGSTGRPKAVVVPHRAIENHQRWMQRAFDLRPDDRVLQKARLDFDASVWEIWAPLVAGARLVLAPAGVRRDPAGLIDAVDRHRITTLHAVPTLLGLILDQPAFADCASLLRVCCGGEALGRELGRRFFASGPRCALFNLYGPAEVTIQASCAKYGDARSLPGESSATLPIGGPIAGACLRLLDADLRPAGEGVVFVGGAGLARGYLRSPAETARRFLPDPFAVEPGKRLYDTGDLARRLPGDTLEFRGRADHQLGIRGFRVEPAEIEAALSEHPAVREVLVVARDGPSGPVVRSGDRPRDPRLVAYVVTRAASSGAAAAARQAEHLALWQSIFDRAYGEGAAGAADAGEVADPAADFASWDSSFTGQPLPAEEMHDAVRETVARILGLSPRRVLEVGCGTGLLAFRVAPHCAGYLGTDISASVIETVRRRCPASLGQLTVRAQPAHDFSGIAPASFDTVVCNSVIGHFPGMNYLIEVLEGMVEATAEGGTIFIGDVRNLPLLEALMGSIELFKAPADLAVDELSGRVRRGVLRQNRLAVDPAFFVALKRRLPRISEVRIVPKTGRFVTELTRFRYDAFLHLDRSAAGLPPLASPAEQGTEWLDWRAEGLSPAALRRRLERDRPAALGLAGVPSARLRREVELVETLARPAGLGTVAELRDALASLPDEGIDPDDFAALLEGSGYVHELSWARCDARGGFDVVLWRPENGRPARRPAPPEPAASRLDRPWSAFGTDPLRSELGERLIPRWRRHLESRLAEHMLPSAYVLLDALPRTANGKLDRCALPPPGAARPALDTVFVAPRDETEEGLAAIWREVLGVDEIGVHDSFFDLGGHSLLATQVASRVRRLFRVPLPLRSLLDAPTVAEVAGRLARERSEPAGLPVPPPIVRARRPPRLPLSFAQQRLWFFDRLAPGNVVYNQSALFELDGPLDVEALRGGLRCVMRRHEVLRTTFASSEDEPFQVIHEAPELDFQVVDLSAVDGGPARTAACDAAVSRTVTRPFDLRRGPLLRVRLLRFGERAHRLLLAFHHIVSDGWSRKVLYRELGVFYRGFAGGRPAALPELAIQYADYALWQRGWLRGEVLERYLELWRRKLGRGLPRLALPYDRPAPARPTWRGATRPLRLRPTVFQALAGTCREHRATPSMGLLAALDALLFPWSVGRPVVVGTVIAGRNHEAVEDLIGFFVNVLPLITDAGGDPSFGELLGRVRESGAMSDALQDLPFDRLVEELQPRRAVGATPLFQMLFNYQSEPPDELELAGLSATVLAVPETTSKFELSLLLEEGEGTLAGHWIYRTELFDAATVEALADRFEALLSRAANDPRLTLGRLSEPTGVELRAVLEGPEPPPGEGRVDERIREWARRVPEAPAVVVEDRSLTYGELARRAGRLAHELRRIGVGPEVPVVIALERSVELMVAMLAVLDAGGYWAALDLSQPRLGRARVLAELNAPVIVSDRSRAADLPAHGATVVLVDRRRIGHEEGAPGGPYARPENLAYAVFTSGSTGRAKAVGVEHRQLLAYVDGMRRRLDLGPGAGWASVSTFAADLGHTAVFGALCSGGRLHLIRREQSIDPRAMADYFDRCRIDCLKIVPSHLRALHAVEGPPAVAPRRWLIVGGEAAPREWLRDWCGADSDRPGESDRSDKSDRSDRADRSDKRLGACRVLNHYGPSETTVGVLAREVGFETGGGATTLPLGQPLAGVRIHLLTAAFEPALAWLPGEIVIGGATVSRGYLGRPSRTAGSFVPDPFSRRPSERLYRSGDRARLLPGGDLEFLGRLDHQVKLHGFRVELDAIRQALVAHAAVRDGVIRLLEDGRGDAALVAFYVAGEAAEPEGLRRWLAREVPEEILPHHFVRLDALPLRPNGKLDPEALPGLEAVRVSGRRRFTAPRSATEAAVAAIWAEVLRLDRVGAGDDFFELGGHSLFAVVVASRLGRAFGVQEPLRLLFTLPVLADLARAIDSARSPSEPDGVPPPIRALEPGDARRRRLSFAQRRLWFLDQFDGGRGSYYNVPAVFGLEGELRVAHLLTGFAEVVRRHEVLRTTFPSRDGRPRLSIAGTTVLDGVLVDLSRLTGARRRGEALRQARGEAQRPFDLARGPLFRIRLFRLGAREHVLQLVLHHIVADGASRGVLYRELSALYATAAGGRVAALPALAVQYADFAAWQRESLSGDVLELHLGYWRRRLDSLPALLLPADLARPAEAASRGARLHRRLDGSLASALRGLGGGAGASLYMTLLAAFTVLLSRLSGQRDFAVGSPFSHRGDPRTEELIGCFINLLALRPGSVSGSFAEHLCRVRDTVLDALAHQGLAFEKLVEELAPERDLSRHPLFQVTLDLQEARAELALAGLAVRPIELDAAPVELDLELYVRREGPGGGLSCRFSYRRDLFEPTTVGRWIGHFETLLREIVAGPERPAGALAIHSPAERHQVLAEWNDTGAPLPAGAALHELFARQAARTPDRAALVWEAGGSVAVLSYASTERRARRLAAVLRDLGVGADDRVAIVLERGPELVLSMLGVLEAGAAYLPLDPDHPRLAELILDARATAVVSAPRHAARLSELPVPIFEVGRDGEPAAAADSGRRQRAGRPAEGARAAYVLYTSGSTGRPKGVVVSHAAIVSHMRWMQSALPLGPDDRVLQKTPATFDASVWEFWAPLQVGAPVVLAPPGSHRDPGELLAVVRRQGIHVLQVVPSLLEVLLDEPDMAGCSSLSRVVCGGEPLASELADRFFSVLEARLYNVYGPTEATIHASFERCRPGPGSRVTLGRPIRQVRLHVLDRELRASAVGAAGELHVAGAGLARAYLDRPRTSAASFVPDPFAGIGARLYRTGDWARYLADGRLEFLGRRDHQVKLRGVRVELGEIEAALAAHRDVRRAAVVLAGRGAAGTGKRALAAFVESSGRLVESELSAFLARRLPDYLVPRVFVALDTLPRSASGKIDRALLEQRVLPEAGRPGVFSAARTATEEIVSAFWEEVLDIRGIGIHDDFFALGGHSLLATQVVSRVRRVFEIELPLRRMFDDSTVAGLARRIDELRRSDQPEAGTAPPIRPTDDSRHGSARLREAGLPLSFAQQRLWFLQQLDPESGAYNIPGARRLSGELDVAALNGALGEITRRHAVLRTRFPAERGKPRQSIAPAGNLRLPMLDLTSLAESDRPPEVCRRLAAEAARPFDLAREYPLRLVLARLAATDHVLFVNLHHIASDGWSQGLFRRELAVHYVALAAGRSSPMAELPLQYADFAVWQREWLQGEVLEAQLAYWRMRLSGLKALELMTDRPRHPGRRSRARARRKELPDRLGDSLRRSSRAAGVSLYMTLLAAFTALLRRVTGQRDVALGTPVANRHREELEGLIGFFVNTLVMRVDLHGDPSFAELLKRVRELCLEAYDHQQVPFEKLVDELEPERDPDRSPLFQVMFAVYAETGQDLAMPGLEVSALPLGVTVSHFDLTVSFHETGERLISHLAYDEELFDQTTIARLERHFGNVLTGLVADPSRVLSRLPLLGPSERHQLLAEWSGIDRHGSVRRSPEGSTDLLHELFEALAARTPDAVAAVFEHRSSTYGELDAQSDRIARWLRARGAGPEVVVGIRLARGLEMMSAVLGTLKAGAAYLPLDVDTPAERATRMLENSGSTLLLTSLGEVPATGPRAPGARAAVSDRNAAYVLYTSGTTGHPKGIVVEHRQIVSYLRAIGPRLDLEPGFSYALVQRLSVDSSLTTIFPPLISGGRLHLLSEIDAIDSGALAAYFERHRIDVLKISPSHLVALDGAAASRRIQPRLRLVIGGEAWSRRRAVDWSRHGAGCRIDNHYGPTEATVGSHTWRVRPEGGRTSSAAVPIGRPLANTVAYVADERLEPVPAGAAGGLMLGGRGVARGYLGRPALTAASFLPDPLAARAGSRLYRTGDRVRYTADGAVEFLGRNDEQVKIRGFRVEPQEIETVLCSHPGIRDAAVVARRIEDATRLCAYVVAVRPPGPGGGGIRRFLKSKLPRYMVPELYESLEALPRTAHGKTDRAALARRPPPPVEAPRPALPAHRSAAERKLAHIWCEVLRLENPNPRDNFFKLGGDSISGIEVVARARRDGLPLAVRDVFQHQTLAELAVVAETVRGQARLAPAEQELVTGPVPLTPIQLRFFDLAPAEPSYFNWTRLSETRRPLKPNLMERALAELCRHHDALRLRFERREDGWSQWLAGREKPSSCRIDLSRLDEEAAVGAIEPAAARLQRSLDLTGGPLVRMAMFDLGPRRPGRVLFIAHHLIVDAVAWRLLMEDLERVYLDLEARRPVRLPAKTHSFKRWSERLVQSARRGAWPEESRSWLTFSGHPGVAAPLPLPLDFAGGGNDLASADTVTVALGPEATCKLLRRVPAIYSTRVDEVLLTALVRTLFRWTGCRHVFLELEGHGREEIFEDLDLSRTVGWFTAVFPVLLSLPDAEGEPGGAIKAIKGQTRRAARQGIHFGILRYLSDCDDIRARLRSIPVPEICFNYLGRMDTHADSSLFRPAAEPAGPTRSRRGSRLHLLEIHSAVTGGRLRMHWTFSRLVHRRRTLEVLADDFVAELELLIEHCLATHTKDSMPALLGC